MHDRTLVVRHKRQRVLRKQTLQPVAEPVAHPSCDLAGVRAFDLADGRVAREAGEGIGCQRAADVGAVLARGEARRHQLRIFLLAADAASRRIAARDDLAEHREIRHDAEIALCARKRHAEAGDDLVEDHQRAIFVAERTDARVIVVRNRARAALGSYRLHEHRRRPAEQTVAL